MIPAPAPLPQTPRTLTLTHQQKPDASWDGLFFYLPEMKRVTQHPLVVTAVVWGTSDSPLAAYPTLLSPEIHVDRFGSQLRKRALQPGTGESSGSFPNCFVYESLERVSSGFPNELVCCRDLGRC